MNRLARLLLPLLPWTAGACEAFLDVTPAVPDAPRLQEFESPTSLDTLELRGSRQANTALFLNDAEVVARAREGAFRLVLPLAAGQNTFALTAVDAKGRSSTSVAVTVIRDGDAPGPVVFDVAPRTAQPVLNVPVVKPRDCSVMLDGDRVVDVPLSAVTALVSVPLAPGPQQHRFACVDAAGNESPVSILSVERFEREAIPFALTVPAVVGASPVLVSADCPDDVEARVVGGVASRCEAGSFSQEVELTRGRNVISVEVAFVGELELAAALHTVQVDFIPGEGEGEGEGT